jgi:AraC-like DNA-binding protein
VNAARPATPRGAIWVAADWFLFAADSEAYDPAVNTTGSLLIGPLGPWRVREGPRVHEGRVMVHAAHVSSTGSGRGLITLWPVPTTPLAQLLKKLAPGTCEGQRVRRLDHLLQAPGIAALVEAFDALKTGGGDTAALAATVARLEQDLATDQPPSAPIDPRAAALALRLRDPATAALRATAHAEALALSPDRLRHLFVDAFDLRMSQFGAWLKLHAALRYVAEAARKPSITDAAQAGGFADAAHLANMARRMFAMKPSETLPASFRFIAV